MGKKQLIAVSLVAAVPGAFLAYLMVMAFLSGADKMGGILMGAAGLALVTGTLMAVTPIGLAIFVGRGDKSQAATAEPVGNESGGEMETFSEGVEFDDDAETSEYPVAEGSESEIVMDDSGFDDDDVFAEIDDDFDIDFDDDDKK